MPKRKRDGHLSAVTDHASPSRALEAQTAVVEQRTAHGKKLLVRALKLAKGFERQKLGRRQKMAQAKGSSTELARIGAEIGALKTIDVQLAAESHLKKTLLKIKTIASSPALPSIVSAPTRPVTDTDSLNVIARLYNANPVKEAMADTVESIREALGAEDPSGSQGEKTKAKSADMKVVENGTRPQISNGSGNDRSLRENGLEQFSRSEDSSHNSEAQRDTDGDDFEGFSDDESEDYSHFDARIAVSSDSDSDSDSSDKASTPPRPSTKPPGKATYTPDADLSPSPSPSLSPSLSASASASPPPSSAPPPNPNPSEHPPPRNPATATFLPSLTLGGYWSGSESPPSDLSDADAAPRRKNRRGQRARQKIWEKKHGANARHLRKAGAKAGAGKKGRDEGWDARRGAVRSDGRGGTRGGGGGEVGRGVRDGASASASGANEVAVNKKKKKDVRGAERKRDDEGPLHPSWEAKRKAKERAERQNVAFQGRKIVFD